MTSADLRATAAEGLSMSFSEAMTGDAGDHAWPSHLTRASELGWSFWREFAVRGAGFPANLVQRLSHQALTALANNLVDARIRLTQLWEEAERLVQSRITAILLSHGVRQAGDKPTSPLPPELSRLRSAANLLKRRKLDDTLAAVLPADLYDALKTADAQHAAVSASYKDEYATALDACSSVIQEFAAHSSLREAVAWQNHAAVVTALDPLGKAVEMSGARRKQREELVANYIQRYCVKNDSIGFFGPIGWGQVREDLSDPVAKPGPGLLAARNIYFEDWPIAAIADAIASDSRFTAWLTPRLMPFLRIERKRLIFPGGMTQSLSDTDHELLRVCNGNRTAAQIADALLANPFSNFCDADQVYLALTRLKKEGRIDFGFPIPSNDPRPELVLRAQFERIDDDSLRIEAQQLLSRFEAARQLVEDSRGRVEDFCAAMTQLNEVFESITGAQSRRRQGEAYGGRALVYEDCRRDVRVEVGQAFLQSLQKSLDLVLISARWFTQSIAPRYQAELRKIFFELCGDDPNGSTCRAVDLPTFWLRAQELFFGENIPVSDIVEDLGRRWQAILPPLDDVHRIDIAASEIRDAVMAAFEFERSDSTWAQAIYQCPDVLLCSPGEASGVGDGHAPMAVLGEIHVGGNTLTTNGFLGQHPDPQRLLAARRTDLGPDNFVPKLSGVGARIPIRTRWVDDAEYGIEVLFSHGARPSAPQEAVPIGALDIVEQGGDVVVRHREQAWQCGLLDLFGDFVALAVISQFRMFARRRHVPRITVGSLVWQREAWRLPVAELAFMAAENDAQVFLDVRQKALELGLPSKVFVKVPWENKPFYVDLESPAYVRGFAKQIRGAMRNGIDGAAEISISEMLPSFEHLWLSDADGQKYTSELRMVAVHGDDARASMARAGGRSATGQVKARRSSQ